MITTNLAEVLAALNGMAARVRNTKPALDAIGDRQASAVMLRIMDTKRDPDGVTWAPWSARRRGERDAKGNIGQGLLWDSGTLLASIAVQTTAAAVVIGSDVVYAPDLQDGIDNMPARPFLGWSPGDIQETEKMMLDYIETGL